MMLHVWWRAMNRLAGAQRWLGAFVDVFTHPRQTFIALMTHGPFATMRTCQRHIAQVLEVQFPDTAATHPELQATTIPRRGPCREQGVGYWQRAGPRGRRSCR